MNKKLYLIFLCAFALATLACSDDSVTGSSDVALVAGGVLFLVLEICGV